MTKLTDEQVARKRKDKHAKHDAEQKQERKEHKFPLRPEQLDHDPTWTDYDEA